MATEQETLNNFAPILEAMIDKYGEVATVACLVNAVICIIGSRNVSAEDAEMAFDDMKKVYRQWLVEHKLSVN